MWVKLHTKLLNWEWYSDINVTRLFIHLLLKANWKDRRFKNIKVQRGSLITGRKKLAEETGLTERQVRTALEKLKMSNNIAIKTTTKYSIITIQNYNLYQENDQQNVRSATTITDITEYTEIKKEKINKKEKKFKKPTLEEVKNYISEKELNIQAESFIDYYEGNGWKVGRNAMKDWKATIRNWNRRQGGGEIKFKEQKPNWYGKEISEEKATEEEIKKLEVVLNAN